MLVAKDGIPQCPCRSANPRLIRPWCPESASPPKRKTRSKRQEQKGRASQNMGPVSTLCHAVSIPSASCAFGRPGPESTDRGGTGTRRAGNMSCVIQYDPCIGFHIPLVCVYPEAVPGHSHPSHQPADAGRGTLVIAWMARGRSCDRTLCLRQTPPAQRQPARESSTRHAWYSSLNTDRAISGAPRSDKRIQQSCFSRRPRRTDSLCLPRS